MRHACESCVYHSLSGPCHLAIRLRVVGDRHLVARGDKDCHCCTSGKVGDVSPDISIGIFLHHVEHLLLVVYDVEVPHQVNGWVIVVVQLSLLRVIIRCKSDSYSSRRRFDRLCNVGYVMQVRKSSDVFSRMTDFNSRDCLMRATRRFVRKSCCNDDNT